MEQSTHTERIAALVGEARELDEQVAELAHRIHIVHEDITVEVSALPDDAEDLFPFYERSRLEELRTVAGAMSQRLDAAVDEKHPGAMLNAAQRDKFREYGLGGFGIDPDDVAARQWVDAGAGNKARPVFAVGCTCRQKMTNHDDLVSAMRALASHRDSHGLEPWDDDYKVHIGSTSPDLDQETVDAALEEAKAVA